MESDSDSDGSHVSTTPPRQPNPPPLTSHPPQPPLIFSKNTIKPSRSKKAPSKPLRSKITPSKPSTSKNVPPKPSIDAPKPEMFQQEQDPFLLQIQRTSDFVKAPSTSTSHLIENLPAGFFSKSTFFSKIQRPLFDLEASGNEPVFNSPSGLVSKVENSEKQNTVKFVNKIPNLIGRSVPRPTVKLRKCGGGVGGGEGNFVRLDLSGKRKRFMNKGWRKNGKFRGDKRYKRNNSVRKGKLVNEGEDEGELNEGDDLVVENVQQQQQKQEGWENDCKVLEEAVSAARVDPSDENLVKLLKLVCGYDSFREGQLEAIKMVLAGKSTMLILPTGAGKSLCYQLASFILPGVTLVVGPLIALMIDQLRQLPPLISGALLSSSQVYFIVF